MTISYKMVFAITAIMVLAMATVMVNAEPSKDRDEYEDSPRMVYEYDAKTDVGLYINDGTIRIYGEEKAIYPTHSYTNNLDFIYPDAVDPFDPGVIAMDSITFNPAYLENMYLDEEITINGGNGDEKIFYRIFYEPGYAHDEDDKMNDPGQGDQSVVMDDGALVTETTYMLVDNNHGNGHSGIPKAGAAKDSSGGIITNFMLPTHCENVDDGKLGMDVGQVVDLNYASSAGTSQLTDGEIEVQTKVFTLSEDEGVNFMDHNITMIRPTHPNPTEVKIEISYIGNMESVEDRRKSDVVNEDQKYYVDRLNNLHDSSDADYRFYFEIQSLDYDAINDAYTIDLIVGRHLVAGETFYVDGVRYDMPAIYVTDDDKFKYITFQSPIPKGSDPIWDNDVEHRDETHVTCQWLANLKAGDTVPVLPPLNENHSMIDDIGLEKFDTCCDGWEIWSEYGNILEDEKGPLDYCYNKESTELRFDSSLAERLYVESDGDQIWNWWSVFTKPYMYTELVLPNDETTDDEYEADDLPPCAPDTVDDVDGSEYLVTTSYIAPNSEASERTVICKSEYTVHDIVDRYSGTPRMVFEYDAQSNDDLFINEDNSVPSVRLYGEADALYPTHSMTGSQDFVYPDYYDPFDPGVVVKDSITFNSAYLENSYDDEEITVDGQDGDENIFFRVFYEPEYAHPVDSKMTAAGSGDLPVMMPEGALVTETTYMLIDNNHGDGHSGLPKAGAAASENFITNFMLPTHSSDLTDDLAGMDLGQVVDLNYASGRGTDQLTDGIIEVQTRTISLDEGDAVNFMDHKIRFLRPTYPHNELKLEISYIGNMNDVEDRLKNIVVDEDQKYYADRLNNLHSNTAPEYRFFFEVDSMVKYGDSYQIDLIVGRRLVAGETFYVDGMRYDMPAVYVTDEDKFKYITFQSPMPKCTCETCEIWEDHAEDNQNDESHVTCQWLAALLPIQTVPVLPPLNEDEHLMIDDIGLEKFTECCVDDTWGIWNEFGNIFDDRKDALDFCYVAESEESRFNSSLAEIHNIDNGVQEWNWWSIYTRPYQYTELVLPEDEVPGETYRATPPTCVPPFARVADGNEYLVTTSFIAPNCEDEERTQLCKSERSVHDIIDSAGKLDGEPCDIICQYDVDGNGYIDKGELKTAILDYLTNPIGSVISKADLKILILDYLDHL